ncbi:hypothetical protein PG997_014584 [Apiospora hydei]|uniref:2EXR domain-containing protein n=1 Tax=Apiospora hydei TaxID=1337664 RepID=A0ABR1UUB8_9PEZI
MTTTDFPQFARMPPEVRRLIWQEAALEAYKDRHLVLGDSQYRPLTREDVGAEFLTKSIHVSDRMKPSAIFLVNRESRKAARSIYNVSLHVYETFAAILCPNACEGPQDPNGEARGVVYKGEVYINLVHDIFVTLDDTHLRINPPMDWVDDDDHAYWIQYPITGRLSEEQTGSIERVMTVHWTNLSGYTSVYAWPRTRNRIPESLIDEVFSL